MSTPISGAQGAAEPILPEKQRGPSLDVKRNQDGRVTGVTLTGAPLPCGSPSSVTLQIGKDGTPSATGRSGFVSPLAGGGGRPHPATRSELEWLKHQVVKSDRLSDGEKLQLVLQIDQLMETAPSNVPGETIIKEPPQFMDDPSQIRRLQGQEPPLYAQAPEFPTPPTRR